MSLLNDRPVGDMQNFLWDADEIISRQITLIVNTITAPIRYIEGPLPSMTFAIYGKWGMGKSSAMQIIEDKCRELGNDKVKFCRYLAPAHESYYQNNKYSVRESLGVAILNAILDGISEKLFHQVLGQMPAVYHRTMADFIETGMISEKDKNPVSSQIVEVFVKSASQYITFERIINDFLSGRGPEMPAQSCVVFIDDLDRCEDEFVWQVLSAVQQWSNAHNLFFIIAIDQQKLYDAVKTRSGFNKPGFAIEKYVQHSLEVPPITEERLQKFISSLAQRSPDDIVLKALVGNFDFMQYGLTEITPRSIKRCINTVRVELEPLLKEAASVKEQRLHIKEHILEYTWPEFYREHFSLAKSELGFQTARRSLHSLSFEQLERICAELVKSVGKAKSQISPDAKERLQFELGQLARRFPGKEDWRDLPLELAWYLGLSPFWFASDTTETSQTTASLFEEIAEGISIAQAETVPATLTAQLQDFYFNIELADQNGNLQQAKLLISQAMQVLAQNETAWHVEQAATVGNIALKAQKFREVRSALILFRIALQMDPDLSNNIQNYVSFILDSQFVPLYSEVENYLALLRTGKHASWRPERTNLLTLQYQNTVDRPIDPSIIEAMWEEFISDPTHRTLYGALMQALRNSNDLDRMEEASRIFFETASLPDDKYFPVRGFADMLPKEGDSRFKSMDMYQDIIYLFLPVSSEAREDEADIRHNYATLLYTEDYDSEAGENWYRAYSLDRNDNNIRRAYGRYLLRLGKGDLVEKVNRGEPIDEKILGRDKVPLPEYFLDKEIDRWWRKL